MMSNAPLRVFLAILICGLAACGGSGGGGGGGTGGSQTPNPPPPVLQTGMFIDAPVAGLDYESRDSAGAISASGTTNVQGEFNYVAGDTVSFSLANGAIRIGSAAGSAVITPADLVNQSAMSQADKNPAFRNLLRLLQSLDVDGDPGNGIELPAISEQDVTGGGYPDGIDLDDFAAAEAAFGNDPALSALIARHATTGSLVDGDTAERNYEQAIAGVPTYSDPRPDFQSPGGGAPANGPPSFTSPTAAEVSEGETATGYVATATDPDGEAVTFGLSGGADVAAFSIDPVGGGLSFITAPDFEAPTDSDANNTYVVGMVASDGANETTQVVTVTVLDVDETPPNRPPSLTSPTSTETLEGSASTGYTATATDPDGDAVTFGLSGGADVGAFSIDPVSGALSFNTPPSFAAPTDSDANNTYVVGIVASDGKPGGDASLTLTVTVKANQPPVVDAGSDKAIITGGSVTLDGRASSDPEGDPLSFSWRQTAGTPAAVSSSCTATEPDECGAQLFVTTPVVAADETLTFELTVEDALGAIATDFANVSVTVPIFLTEGGDLAPKADIEFGDPGYAGTYYGKVDPQGLRTTLVAWRAVNGFDSSPGAVVNARYINAYDLGFGRDMYCIDAPNLPCYVQNYLDPTGPGGGEFVVTVAMERQQYQGRTVVAFFAFDRNGDRLNAVALDSEGAKSIPESCYACHFGYADNNGNPFGGVYLPWDLDVLDDWPGRPTISSQADALRLLNRAVHGDASLNNLSIQALVQAWYDGAPLTGRTFNGNRLPEPGWYSDTDAAGNIVDTAGNPVSCATVPLPAECERYFRERFLYKNINARFCRGCHGAQGPIRDVNPDQDGLDWSLAAIFAVQAYNSVCAPPASQALMPHAELTFDRFGNDVINFTDGSSATAQQRLCSEPPPPAQTFADLIQGNCASSGCHGGTFSPNLAGGEASILSATDGVASSQGMPYITRGSADQSYLYRKVIGTHTAIGGTGQAMPPPNGFAVDSPGAKLIRDFINGL